MGLMKKWKQEVWFAPKEDDTVGEPVPVQQPPPEVKEKKEKKEKKVKKVKKEKLPAPSDDYEMDEHYTRDFQTDGEKFGPTWKDHLWLDRRLRIFYVVVICLFIGVICPALISYYLGEYRADLGNCDTPARYRMECLSGSPTNVTECICRSAGCCWNPDVNPKCFQMSPTRYTYGTKRVVHNEPHRISVDLTPEWRQSDPFGRPLTKNVRCNVRTVNKHHLIIEVMERDANDTGRLLSDDLNIPFDESDFDVNVETGARRSFGISVKRVSTGTTLLDTTYGPMILSPDYAEISVSVPGTTIFGLGSTGEKRVTFARSFTSYTKLAIHHRDGADGFHPFFMAADPETKMFHGVYWDNPYPLEVQLSPAPVVTFRSMGGNIVIHLLSGPTPADVSNQLAKDLLGTPAMPPFWSLGFHMCRESNGSSTFWNTIMEMEKSAVPYDSDCIDLRLSGPGAGGSDLLSSAEIQREALRDRKKKFILAQPPHMVKLTDEIQWIASNESGTPITVKRFNSDVYLPSYPGGPTFNWNDLLQPEGIHLVDNRPTDETKNRSCNNFHGVFVPEKLQNTLTKGELCLDAYHPTEGLEHVAVHSQYGIQQLESWVWQSFGYSRLFYSNKASAWGNSGWAAHPGEDYSANWVSMQAALVQVLEMGLYGIAQAGAPICGSTNVSIIDNVPKVYLEQLCTRWYQMGLLMPYAHSFSKLGHFPRSPIDWSNNFRRVVAGYIQQRYRLLPYYYTLFYQAKTVGMPVVRPLWYQFPEDTNTYNVSEQFMIGDAVMVCPALVQTDNDDSAAVSAYFPHGTWYDYHTGQMLLSSKGERHILMTGLSHVNMIVKNGTVFVTQEPGKSAEETRINNYIVTVSAPFDMVEGYLYVDDGYSPNELEFDLVRFAFNQTTFSMEVVTNNYSNPTAVSTVVDEVRILGLDLKPHNIPDHGTYNNETQVLRFTNLSYNWKESSFFTLEYFKSN